MLFVARHSIRLNPPNICQDRLGTNLGKAAVPQKREPVFSQIWESSPPPPGQQFDSAVIPPSDIVQSCCPGATTMLSVREKKRKENARSPLFIPGTFPGRSLSRPKESIVSHTTPIRGGNLTEPKTLLSTVLCRLSSLCSFVCLLPSVFSFFSLSFSCRWTQRQTAPRTRPCQ